MPSPAAPAAPVVLAEVTSANSVAADSVKDRILALAVEETGYPIDMLDLDLDLEADLGVDTVKQAEMFAAIRAAYDIPRDENRKLRDYPTLAHVIRFVYENGPIWLRLRRRRRKKSSPLRLQQLWSLSSRCPLRHRRKPSLAMMSRNAFSRSSSRRLGIRKTCSIWISISKLTSASIP